jgi:hypothetical protein
MLQPAPEACGLNGRGERPFVCVASSWVAGDACDDPDQCVDGDVEQEGPCGPNDSGTSTSECVGGMWQSSCVGADDCTNGDVQPSTLVCGYDGHYEEVCTNGSWQPTSTCRDDDPDDAALADAAANDTLSFQCNGPALSPSEIIDRFPAGQAIWTPSYFASSTDETIKIVHYTRDCTKRSQMTSRAMSCGRPRVTRATSTLPAAKLSFITPRMRVSSVDL